MPKYNKELWRVPIQWLKYAWKWPFQSRTVQTVFPVDTLCDKVLSGVYSSGQDKIAQARQASLHLKSHKNVTEYTTMNAEMGVKRYWLEESKEDLAAKNNKNDLQVVKIYTYMCISRKCCFPLLPPYINEITVVLPLTESVSYLTP